MELRLSVAKCMETGSEGNPRLPMNSEPPLENEGETDGQHC